ncbi:extracellular solute-binding protein, partial [Candidatus Bathyarchaeota archaeon]|nr:extracellular solute-binding protein [Candidatus Bathyarchaeota archaeon]
APTPVATPTATPTWTPPGGKYPWEERPAEYYQPITPGLEALNLIIDYAAFSSPTIEAGFLKSTGIKNINVDVYTDELKMFAKIKPGGHGYDLIHLHYVPDPKDPKNRPGLWKRQQIDLGEGPFLEPIDMRVMSNFKDGLYPSVEFWEKICKWDGKWYTIPHELFIDAPASNRDYVSDEEASTIEMLWNPKFRNRIAMPDFIMSVVVGGIYTGAKFPWNQTKEELEKTKKALLEQKKLVRAYWASAGDLEALFAAKEVYAAFSWYACVAKLIKEGFPIRFMPPKEGTIVGACHHAVAAESKYKYEGTLWLNWNLSAERQTQMFKEAGYPPSSRNPYRNKEVFTEEVMELWQIPRIEKVFNEGHYYSLPDLVDEYVKLWAEVRAA